jgi:hypothetical protein
MPERIMTLLGLLLAAAAAAPVSGPPMLGQPSIMGKTRAPSQEIAQSAFREAAGFALRALKCGEVGSAKASLMPKGWVPADANFRVGPKGARYERWELQGCGRSEPFLVVFWTEKGIPDFQVAHPFPADAPKAGKPSEQTRH